jgi:hypothetical protein
MSPATKILILQFHEEYGRIWWYFYVKSGKMIEIAINL